MTTPTPIEPGDIVIATTANGEEVRMRALAPPVRGRDFTVVWLATEVDFQNAKEKAVEADAVPWPVTAIRGVERPVA